MAKQRNGGTNGARNGARLRPAARQRPTPSFTRYSGAQQPVSSFSPRVIAVIVILLVIFLGWTFFWLLYAERQSLFEARTAALGSDVSLALDVISLNAAQASARGLSTQEAQRQALEALAGLRFGSQREGYFFVLDRNGHLLLHPLRPDLVGGDMRFLVDAKGKAFIGEMLSLVMTQREGYLTYSYNWLGDMKPAGGKLCYAALYEPWNWVVASEMSHADIDEQITSELLQQAVLLFVVTLMLAFVLSVTLRRLVLSSVDRMIGVANRLSAGDLSARVEVLPTDEMGALALAINQMADGIQHRDAEIRLTQRTAVFALAKLAEARDNETGGHLLRVREFAILLARELRDKPGWEELIDDQFIEDLYEASLLHDIGKVGIPDHILRKPDVLDEGEMAIMMSHTLIGANTIRLARKLMKAESGFLRMAEQIARSHHERWDGMGYVEQLSGAAIPPSARIFTIADVYDALTTARPYKPAYSHEEALASMREERGKRFDPQIFDVFIEIAGRFDAIRRDFADA